MSDLELLDDFCDTCFDFVSPVKFREIEKRGLTHYVNLLPSNPNEAKVVVRSRLSKEGKYVGNKEIEQIADNISSLERLRLQLNKLNMADAHLVLPILKEMTELSEFVRDYFKPSRSRF